MTAREELAAAASSVEGITVAPYYVQNFNQGTGVVRLERTDYPNPPLPGVCTWNVVIWLSQDQAAAEKYLDEKGPLIRAALSEAAVVQSVVFQKLELPPPNGSVQNCAFFNCFREEE